MISSWYNFLKIKFCYRTYWRQWIVFLILFFGLLLLLISCKGEQDDVIGDCFVSPDPDRICSEEYQPVCACNDEVYSNSCYAEKAGNLKWKPTNKDAGENCQYE